MSAPDSHPSISHWLPPILTVAAMSIAAALYHRELVAWFTGHGLETPARASAAATGDSAYYTCSMHPSVKSKIPGKCPICSMELEPVTWEELRTGTIRIDSHRRQLIGVKTQTVQKRDLVKEVRAVGLIAYDPTRLTDVSLKSRSWVGDLYADFTGKRMEKGRPLMTVYSPELLAAEQDYLAALSDRANRSPEGAARRLLLLDMTQEQIDDLARRGKADRYVPILSPASGTVVEKNIVRGGAIEAGTTVLRIADLAAVWIEADLYEDAGSIVQVGQEATVSLSYLPDKTFQGKVAYIYPYLDPKTHRVRARIEISNPDGFLKPGMYADVTFKVPLGSRLAIPRDAVLYGGDSRIVFLDLDEVKIKPQRIKTGQTTDDYIEVLDGLKEGDTLITSGNFLIASESKLKSGIEKW